MIKLLYRVRWVLIIGLLFFSSAFADESSCPAIQQMNPEAQARKYCETFFSYNYDKTPEIRETGLACVNLYKRVVQNVQEICLYVKEGRALREKEPAMLAQLERERSQVSADRVAVNETILARFLSRKWWMRMIRNNNQLDDAYRTYLENRLKSLVHFGYVLLEEELLDKNNCGRRGAPVSLNIIGLSAISADEAGITHERMKPVLVQLQRDLLGNSNRLKGNERALDKILDRAGSATSLGNPGEGEPAGHRAEAPHGHGVAAKVLEGAGVGYGVGRAEKEAHKILHLHHGRLVANPVSLGV